MFLTGRQKRQKSKGFLLLEIMISVSILSFGVLLILDSFVRPLRATELSMDYFKAGLLLEEKMSELYNSGMKDDGIMRGEFSGFDSRFFWAMDISDLESGFCREISLKVYWRNKNKEEDLSVSTYI